MLATRKSILIALVLASLLVGCTAAESQPVVSSPTRAAATASLPPLPSPSESTGLVGMPNPASVFCVEQGGKLEIRTDSEGGQYGVCLFPDGSECDEWAFFRGECAPGQPQEEPASTVQPRYSNEEYGFSFDPPPAWEINSDTNQATFTRPGYRLYVGFQMADQEPLPFRTGMPEGEFVDGGQASLLGQSVPKQILVYEGKNKVVAYNGRIKVGDLILVMYLDAVDPQGTSYRDLDIPQEIMAEADQIIATFALNSGEKPEIQLNP